VLARFRLDKQTADFDNFFREVLSEDTGPKKITVEAVLHRAS
jgi:hypothetical protein